MKSTGKQLHTGVLSRLRRRLSALLRLWQKYRIVRFRPIAYARNSGGERGALLPAGRALAAGPEGRVPMPHAEGEFPPVMHRMASDAWILGPRRNGWFSAGEIHLQVDPPVTDESDAWSFAAAARKLKGVRLQRGQHALLAFSSSPVRVDRGVYLGAFAADNWYHWLLEFLPRVWLARELPGPLCDWPVLVPHRATLRSSFQDSLASLVDAARVRVVPDSAQVRVDELVCLIGSPRIPGS